MKIRLGLRAKFLAILIGSIVLLGTAIVSFVKMRLYDDLITELQKNAQIVAADIAAESIDALLTDDFYSLQMIVTDHKQIWQNIEYVFVTDRDGNIVAHTFEKAFPLDLKKASIVSNIQTDTIYTLETDRGIMFDAVGPILKGDIGVVHVGVMAQPISNEVNRIITAIVSIVVAVSAVAGVLAFYFVGLIVTPIRKLIKVIEIVRTGDLSQQTPVTSSDEIGLFTEAFNKMTGDLRTTTTSIEQLNEEITERKRAEEEIKQAKEKYETLVSNMPEAIYSALANEKGTCTFMSERWGQWSGYNTNDPEVWQKSVHPDDRERAVKVYLEAAKEKKDYIIDYRLVHKDSGQVRWVWDHSSPVIDEKGNVVRFDGIVTDITERKQAQEEREHLLKTIQVINENLQSIVYVASHDLRSPLVNIEGFSDELSQTCLQIKQMLDDSSIDDDLKQKLLMLLDEDITESIKFITAGASKMAMLLNGLLQVSRIGTTEVEIKPLDMGRMMDDIRQATEFQIQKGGVELILDDIPDCLGDKAMTNQLFSNILGNALKYLDPKRPGRIHVSGRSDDGMSVYCIEDNGIGIDQAHQKRIFEIFQRVNPDDDAGGEGLGLNIVTRILDRLDGRIRVESETGKGSKFFIALPKAELKVPGFN